MLKIIYNFMCRRYWIYLFPALMDFSVGFLSLLVSIKGVRLGAAPFLLGVLGSTWGASYFIFNLLISRFAKKETAKAFMVLGCIFYIIIAPSFIFFHSLAALFILSFLMGPATAFFFVGFQLFMGEGANLPVLKSTAFYTLGWSAGLAFGSLASGTLVEFSPVFSTIPVVATSLLIIAGIWYVGKFSAKERGEGDKKKIHVDSGIEKKISPETEKAYLLLGWAGIFGTSMIRAGTRVLIPKLVIDFFGLSATLAGNLIFFSFIIQAGVGFLLMNFPEWRYNFKVHSRFELFGLIGLFLSLAVSGLAGVVILTVVFGVYAGHAFYNGVFYSLCQESKSGRNISINESLVGISNILGPVVLGAALQFGVEYFFLAIVLLLAFSYSLQIFLVRDAEE